MKVATLIETRADAAINDCLLTHRSFAVIAGAGSGKTMSLITALQFLRKHESKRLRRDDKQIACITYTNRAVEVISRRLEWDPVFSVSTLHTFLWAQIKRFTPDIEQALVEHVIPQQIADKKEDDNGGNSQRAVNARQKIASLTADLEGVRSVSRFEYSDSIHSDYSQGQLSHDDVISISAWLISENEVLRKIIGQRFPYIFVDEAQDTFNEIIIALNVLCAGPGLPLVGYFGDPMQQIYDKRAGDFSESAGVLKITKEENFRCACEIVRFLNAFRTDIQQRAAGKNANIEGSVELRLVRSEKPSAPRNRYTPEQLDRASARFDEAIRTWGWGGANDVKYLFLARQMIARRMEFTSLHDLFTGPFASSRAQEDYEKGAHFLLVPFVSTLFPLLQASEGKDLRKVLDILRQSSPAFDPEGRNATRTLGEMKQFAEKTIAKLRELWSTCKLKEILLFARDVELCAFSERLTTHLNREARHEEFNAELHNIDKADWLADAFFAMNTTEIGTYVDFVSENTPFSTQHGVKGEQYPNVVVLFDDIEAAWNIYNFTKMLTPNTAGAPTDGQRERSRRLAYVCFSRAEVNLRILLFTLDPNAAKRELISQSLLTSEQIVIA
jgi:DNA helicase-2/ATP-dependent DNA helicase PcrA